MPKFPIQEDSIVDLASQMILGLQQEPSLLSEPLEDAASLNSKLEFYLYAFYDLSRLREEMLSAVKSKDEALAELTDTMKQIIRQVENDSNFDDETLTKIGWGKNGRNPQTIPGQVKDLQASSQGADWVKLNWRTPDDGGKIIAYRIELFDGSNSKWVGKTQTKDNNIVLVEQPIGKVLEYRVVAMNRLGDGLPSDSVEVAL